MPARTSNLAVAIACGGTGGHLFPGQAVAEELLEHGCAVTLFVSTKDVDREAAASLPGVSVVALPAVGLSAGAARQFLMGFWRAFRLVRAHFRSHPHQAVLAMGGFTSAAPVLAGRLAGMPAFLHESNTIPGRANRWLARWVRVAFVGFPQAARRLPCRAVEVVGTPVRPQFREISAPAARRALGLDPERPVLLVLGGSQGATAVNDLVVRSLDDLRRAEPGLQFLHLTGRADFEKTRGAYQSAGVKAVVRPFLTEMELAMGAASVAVSRAGASSLAELAAMRLPAVLIPYPFAADNHQFHNALAFVETGAARMLTQQEATPEVLSGMVSGLLRSEPHRQEMRLALAAWHRPDAARRVAQIMLERLGMSPCGLRETGEQPLDGSKPNLPGVRPPAACGAKP